ncbi:MAG: DUF1501 domain-containing protein [Armatimonas sp.]
MSVKLSRREALAIARNGIGGVALSALLADEAKAQQVKQDFPGKARAVIFLYMDGGPSQIDTFDPKPALEKYHGKPLPIETPRTQFNNNGNVLKSPWSFKKYGQSGLDVSELFPEVATCADDLCVLRSMTSNFSEHTNANYFLHTGTGNQGRPSMGAWATYGLGSTAKNLPGYIVINGGLIPNGGLDCFGSGFLPPTYQGSIFLPRSSAVADLNPTETSPAEQKKKLELLAALDKSVLGQLGHAPAVEAAMKNYELAFAMQSAVPELTGLSGESEATKSLYGLDHEFAPTRTFGMQCLLARRMVERGVRFVELTHPSCGHDRWDQHGNLKKGHEDNARMVDKPIAGLLKDLKQRGMLDSTLVLWGSEFGRTPMAQGSDGRDHNPFGFTMWMAGGGVKGGTIYGETDELGYYAVKDKIEMHDLHATMLKLLGFDHKKLTFRFGGRDMRLTDVHGNVLDKILA